MSNTPIGDVDMPDPWMIAHEGRFYLTFTLGNRVEIWSSRIMEDFHKPAKAVIWQPEKGSDWSADIWAPELHWINNIWYIYTAGAMPGLGNSSHRTLVLRSSDANPMNTSAWTFLGPLKGLPDHWNIDATVFSIPSYGLFCCYSGWPMGDDSDTEQHLFLIKLISPEETDTKTLTTISRPTLAWERPEGGRRGINEGPTWVSMGDWHGIVFSANGSWTNEYKLGLLELCGDDLLRESSWQKRPAPLLISDLAIGGPFGPGHASFIHSSYNDGRIYCIFHGTEKPDEGWNNRKARLVNMGPEHFHSQGRTVCCAKGAPAPSGVMGWCPGAAHAVGPANISQEQKAQPRKGVLDRAVKRLGCF